MDEFKQEEKMPEIPQDEIIEAPKVIEPTSVIDTDVVRELITTMHNLDYNMHHKAMPEGFRRVRVDKMIVPNSFDDYIKEICKVMEIRESTFYQGLMMEAMTLFITKMQKVLEDTEFSKSVVDRVSPDAINRILMNKVKEEKEKLNKLVKEGKYDETLTPSQNLAKFYPIVDDIIPVEQAINMTRCPKCNGQQVCTSNLGWHCVNVNCEAYINSNSITVDDYLKEGETNGKGN